MALSSSQGFRCPQCGARHVWVVDDCDPCGYRSEVSLGWEREGKKRENREWSSRWGVFDFWCFQGLVELIFFCGRLLWLAVRGVVSLWT